MANIRLAMAQINCTVGDICGNRDKIIRYIKDAKELGADIVSFPELAVTGYPPEDLLLKTRFIDDNLRALEDIAKTVNDIAVVIGFADRSEGNIYNAACAIHKGRIKGVWHKRCLPNYGVFDEKRYFKSGSGNAEIFRLADLIFGVDICEDIWCDESPITEQCRKGASLVISINSSPYHAGRIREREDLIRRQARANKAVISYVNLVGGQDELVFDGQSMVVDHGGRVIGRANAFSEDLFVVDCDIQTGKTKSFAKALVVCNTLPDRPKGAMPKREFKPLDQTAEIYEALVLGLKDYTSKNGFTKVVMGLSGGVDSSLVASIACDALGKENVLGVYMPTHYSSAESEADAKAVASNLGVGFKLMSIEHIFKLYLMALESQFSGMARDVTEENMQARIRGNILMALSNKFGFLVLATGNKSEMSTGYATLYGDMAGGLAVIKDVPKTLVYKLARYRNSIRSVIPESVFTKEPTAELKPNQKDRDTLPPYDLLDRILKAYVEEDKGLDDIVKMGFKKEVAITVAAMVDNSEYKRRQSPPGIKITPRAFGKDRRMPMTNKYR